VTAHPDGASFTAENDGRLPAFVQVRGVWSGAADASGAAAGCRLGAARRQAGVPSRRPTGLSTAVRWQDLGLWCLTTGWTGLDTRGARWEIGIGAPR